MALNAFLNLRPVDPDDEPFLRELQGQVDAERLALQYWSADPETAKVAKAILDLQFRAHAAHYRHVKNNYDTKDCVIELNGHRVGRFIVTQDAKVVYLSDIAVHVNFRGQGLGQAVIEATKQECEQSKRVLHLHVDKMNPAVQFYLGLGFRAIGDVPTHFLMEWVPASVIGKTTVYPGGTK